MVLYHLVVAIICYAPQLCKLFRVTLPDLSSPQGRLCLAGLAQVYEPLARQRILCIPVPLTKALLHSLSTQCIVCLRRIGRDTTVEARVGFTGNQGFGGEKGFELGLHLHNLYPTQLSVCELSQLSNLFRAPPLIQPLWLQEALSSIPPCSYCFTGFKKTLPYPTFLPADSPHHL